MPDTEDLLTRLADRARTDPPWGWSDPPAPAEPGTLARAEEALGFALPPLLAALYTRVADGGFGPEYGLLPLLEGSAGGEPPAVGQYLAARADPEWPWPAGVLQIAHWGCGMYACVDCTDEAAPVLLYEPNGGNPDHAWFADSPSLASWLQDWLDGTGWYDLPESDMDLPAWPDYAHRVKPPAAPVPTPGAPAAAP